MSHCPDFRYRMSGHFEICHTFVSFLSILYDNKMIKILKEFVCAAIYSDDFQTNNTAVH